MIYPQHYLYLLLTPYLADNIFIVTAADDFSLQGIEALINYFNMINKSMEIEIAYSGIILNIINESETQINEIIAKENFKIIAKIPKKTFIRRAENNTKITNILFNTIKTKKEDKNIIINEIKKILKSLKK